MTVLHRACAHAKERIKKHLGEQLRRRSPRRVDLPLSLWRLTRDSEAALCLDGQRLRALLDRFGSPLHMVDGARLHENALAFLAPPPGVGTGCEVYYSYKTNPVPGVLQRLHRFGIGAEVISEYELWLALHLGVAPHYIVYNGPAKSDASLDMAVEREIGLLNLNCREEIPRLIAAARRAGRRPRVGIRVVLAGGWGGQFGERVETGAALQTLKEAVAAPELNVVALHTHLGGEIASPEQVTRMTREALAFCDHARATLGVEFEILDFGGSLACPTTVHLSHQALRRNRTFQCDLLPRAPESVLSIRDYTAQLCGEVQKHYQDLGRPIPRIFLEPGRALTANTQMLLTSVVMTREGEEELTYAILDAGINLAESMRGEYHQIFPVDPPRGQAACRYRFAGPICSPGDVLCYSWALPQLANGDALAIMDAGAYFVPFSTSFSFPKPAIVLQEQGNTSLLRRAETFADLVAYDHSPSAEQPYTLLGRSHDVIPSEYRVPAGCSVGFRDYADHYTPRTEA